MLIAKEKKETNIAEYVIYMWQLEDLVRVLKFDINLLEKKVFGSFTESDELKREIKNWYSDIIQMMQMEHIKESGHLQVTKNVILDLESLHRSIIADASEKKYIELYHKAGPNIYELSKKIKSELENEIQTMFHGLYALLLMRMKKRAVTDETTTAMATFSNLLALLAQKYHEREKKEKTQWDS